RENFQVLSHLVTSILHKSTKELASAEEDPNAENLLHGCCSLHHLLVLLGYWCGGAAPRRRRQADYPAKGYEPDRIYLSPAWLWRAFSGGCAPRCQPQC